MKSFMCLAMLCAAAITAFAADISGTWKGTAETENGTIERTFNFKVDGNKLTGDTASNNFGKADIQDGKIEGDNISFTLILHIQGNDAKVNYKGKVEGDTIKFTVEVEGFDQSLQMIAKRVS